MEIPGSPASRVSTLGASPRGEGGGEGVDGTHVSPTAVPPVRVETCSGAAETLDWCVAQRDRLPPGAGSEQEICPSTRSPAVTVERARAAGSR